MNKIEHIRTLSEFHRTRRLEPPAHPLISVVDYAKVDILPELRERSWRFDFYFISLKRNLCGKIKYGQQSYDFDEGVMFFIGPGQVFRIDREPNPLLERSGWMLLIHPDFFWNTALANAIKRYGYFEYAINEALFVSQKEEQTLEAILENIRSEYQGNLDAYSQQIIISQIETLLNYCERFYNRQFLTRKKTSHQVLEKLERLLTEYFNQDDLIHKGLPTVGYLAEQLHLSPKYLSSLLRSVTGLSAQQHIHQQVIERAKVQLSKPELSIAEIAYGLGFGHPQSFSKFFKRETQSSPLAFRRAFN
ncbi:AraC family transcriptional regulator [Mucilaginibacter sp. AK015]|uniref:helix-turn-helix domain-containing protein n=1 Tax=Mucilaginibacter sp. AK015 TaxID=2723072 RepID=UPI0016070DAE|nr:helix-turn-helix domain-containing protein [Mucilaginibacter sp. AK015]MBB5395194.1 AraC-like DNA-binding protein [Mucilaginibacter sp. AK015]